MQKGGEELRIDQRVMQLFDLMNGLIAQQPSAPSTLRVRQSLEACVTPALRHHVKEFVAFQTASSQGLNGGSVDESCSQDCIFTA